MSTSLIFKKSPTQCRVAFPHTDTHLYVSHVKEMAPKLSQIKCSALKQTNKQKVGLLLMPNGTGVSQETAPQRQRVSLKLSQCGHADTYTYTYVIPRVVLLNVFSMWQIYSQCLWQIQSKEETMAKQTAHLRPGIINSVHFKACFMLANRILSYLCYYLSLLLVSPSKPE